MTRARAPRQKGGALIRLLRVLRMTKLLKVLRISNLLKNEQQVAADLQHHHAT
jgi:hypothetical protein